MDKTFKDMLSISFDNYYHQGEDDDDPRIKTGLTNDIGMYKGCMYAVVTRSLLSSFKYISWYIGISNKAFSQIKNCREYRYGKSINNMKIEYCEKKRPIFNIENPDIWEQIPNIAKWIGFEGSNCNSIEEYSLLCKEAIDSIIEANNITE